MNHLQCVECVNVYFQGNSLIFIACQSIDTQWVIYAQMRGRRRSVTDGEGRRPCWWCRSSVVFVPLQINGRILTYQLRHRKFLSYLSCCANSRHNFRVNKVLSCVKRTSRRGGRVSCAVLWPYYRNLQVGEILFALHILCREHSILIALCMILGISVHLLAVR